MISEQEALERILAATPGLGAEEVSLAECCGRFLFQEQRATLALPSFDNSAVDGYALHEADCGKAPHRITVIGEQPAGPRRPLVVAPGQGVRIFTGAPLPTHTAAVIMQEDTVRDGMELELREAAGIGDFIRKRGADLCEGQVLGHAGDLIGAARCGLFASQGLARLQVGRKPHVAVVVTGNELRPPGESLTCEGQIFNSNAPMLQALLHGVAAVVDAHMVSDSLEDSAAKFTELAQCSDVLVIAGGVSVGDHDCVRPALRLAGFAVDFWKVNMKPGKPFLFGTRPRETAPHQTLVFGLPGNPVSAFVTALLFVMPALRKMAGAADANLSWGLIPAVLQSEIANTDRRPAWVRGTLNAGKFLSIGSQQSHALFTLSRATALCRIPGDTTLPAGSPVEILPLTGI